MFDIGFWELVILFGLGLIILGPERLPKVAMQVGNWAGQARRMARQLTNQMRDELDVDLNQPFTPAQKPNQTYSRPGMDDLKASTPDSSAADEDSEPDANDSNHADAAGESASAESSDAAAKPAAEKSG